jgi:hypothetical protein
MEASGLRPTYGTAADHKGGQAAIGLEPAQRVLRSRAERWEDTMDRIKILDETLWPKVPKDVITEAEHAAVEDTVWIALQGNGHIVAMDGPGDPDVATGDVTFIAEVAPSRS